MQEISNNETMALDEQKTVEQTIPEEDFALEIKYNGELMSLDRQRAVELAQKGMNYDHVYEELKKYKDNPDYSKLEELSNRANMGTSELLDILLNQEKTIPEGQNQPASDKKENDRVDELREFFLKHPDLVGYKSIPKELKEEILKGGPIENAYLNYQNRMLKIRIVELENGNKTPGALIDEGGLDDNDAFASMLLARL